MKRLLSLFLCSLILFSVSISSSVFAQENTPEFVKDYYIVNVADTDEATLVNTTEDGQVELSNGWLGPSDKGTVDLGNGSTINHHYYTKDKNATATYTFTNVPAGEYEVQYHVTHSNSYYYIPLEVTCNDIAKETYIGDLEGTSNLTSGWYTATNITKNTSESQVVVKVTVPDGTFSSTQNIRTAAVRLMPISGYADYVIRNTALNNYNTSFSADSGFTSSNSKYSCYGEAEARQILAKNEGLSAYFNFIKSTSAVTEDNVISPEEYTSVDPGWYDVFYYNPYADSNNDPNVGVEIKHNNETYTSVMDTSSMTKDWHKITGPIYFSGDGSEYVKVTKSSEGSYLRVGAVKLVRKITLPSEQPETKPLISNANYSDGKLTLITNGSSITDDTTIYAIVAAYNDNGNLLSATKTTTVSITAGADDTQVEIPLPSADGTSYKMFIFDNLTNISPLINCYDFTK